MDKSISLVSFDIDGTLINSKGEVLDETKKLIRDLKDKGYLVVLSTGRPFNGHWWIREELGLMEDDDLSITATGAHIRRNSTGESIYKRLLTEEDIRKIGSFKDDKRINFSIHTRDIIYLNEEPNQGFIEDQYLVRLPRLKYGSISDIGHDLTRVCFSGDKNILDDFEKRHKSVLSKDYKYMRNDKNVIEILNKEAGKYEAMAELVKFLGLDLENVMYFGDGANDAKVIKNVGVGVAMENARKQTKESAAYVIGSNDRPSIADFARDYLGL